MVASRINEILQIFPLNYQEIIKLYDEIPLKDIQELAISVDELLKIYNKNPGPWIKDIQNNLLNAIIKKKINNNHLEIIDYLEKGKIKMKKEKQIKIIGKVDAVNQGLTYYNTLFLI